jgi:hypothetical protein
MPHAPAKSDAGTPAGPGAYAAADFVLFHDAPPDGDGPTRTWWVRTDAMVAGYSEVRSPTSFTREAQPDEWMLLLPDADAGATVTAGPGTVSVPGRSLVVVPPGPSRVDVAVGRAVRLFTARSTDLVSQAVNAASYATPHPHVRAAVPLPEPPGGYRVRVYPLDTPPPAGSFGRIWRCTTLMVNYLNPSHGPRDPATLSPHSHEDFEQVTLALDGDHVHHLRWPWTANLGDWRPDLHEPCPAPSAAVIPARAVHTTQAVGPGLHQLADLFCPPRQDFAAKGWVLNAADYPAEG